MPRKCEMPANMAIEPANIPHQLNIWKWDLY